MSKGLSETAGPVNKGTRWTSFSAPIIFRSEEMPVDSVFEEGSHQWGEFVYSYSGLMQVSVIAGQFLSPPPRHGIWLPPEVTHSAKNRYETTYCSIYIAKELCRSLPPSPCILVTEPLVQAILEHLRAHPPSRPTTEADDRLFQVLLDRLEAAPWAQNYLTESDDPLLSPVLEILQNNPADNRSSAELARLVGTTERTLLRRCQKELGMSLATWRRRLRLIRAVPMLEAGHTVEATALDLGYSSASAFISMFRRMTGTTPKAKARDADE